MNIQTMKVIDPITGQIIEAEDHLFDIKKVVHSKDDVKPINKMLKTSGEKKQYSNTDSFYGGRNYSGRSYGKSVITGKERTSSPNGFKASAKCRPEVALGHNKRDPAWVKDRENVDSNGYHKTFLDFGSVEKAYEKVFGEYVEEYNSRQTRNDRKINNYYRKILEDGRNGTMKRNASVDTHRKPVYEFIFQIGKRDQRLDTETSIYLLTKFSLRYMPKHFPNLKPIGIYLHADEYTIDPITKERLEGSVHVHFDYIPIAHALTKEELEEEKKWRKELEQQARTEAAINGKKFNKTKFDEQDWGLLRAQKFGKALQKGMLLQSSMSGACAEMGFRTKGKLTAQIQMEEAVRVSLLDFTESYNITVNREISENKQQAVHIDEYKAREDNKRILEQIELELQENKEIKEENQKLSAELTTREENVKNLEAEKAEAIKKEKEAKALEEKVSPYVERINTLEKDERDVKEKKIEQDARNELLDKKQNLIQYNEIVSLKNISDKQSELDSRIASFENLRTYIDEIKRTNEENKKINSDNAARNEDNARINRERTNDFYKTEYDYKMMKATCGIYDETETKIEEISTELKKNLLESTMTRNKAIDFSVERFTKKCKQIILKFQDAIRDFDSFLKGKTSRDFRELAEDMDRNGTPTFEEYETKHLAKELDWQIQKKEQQYSLKPLKKINNNVSWDV